MLKDLELLLVQDFQILEWELSKYLSMLSTELRFTQTIGLIIIVYQKKKKLIQFNQGKI